MTRAIVCGGRHYKDRETLFAVLDEVAPNVIAHGGATGADALAGEWAKERGISCTVYPANWSLGRSAGPRRNEQMLREFMPDVVVAFPGGRGTADMIRRARNSSQIIEILIVEQEQPR
jgi:hypothetical protein